MQLTNMCDTILHVLVSFMLCVIEKHCPVEALSE